MPRLTARLAPGAAEVMQLDDYGMCAHFNVEARFTARGVDVHGSADALRNLAKAFEDRADRNGGWDQPDWYFRSAAAAAKRLRAAAGKND